MARLFLSYQKQDREIAQTVASLLEQAGHSVWWDDRLTYHEHWDKVIEREIGAADFVVVLWTANSVLSDWVRIEASFGWNTVPRKLVQVRFGDVAVPIAFSLTQYIDLPFPKPQGSPGWQKLLNWLSPKESADAEVVHSDQRMAYQRPDPALHSSRSWTPMAVRLALPFVMLMLLIFLLITFADDADHTIMRPMALLFLASPFVAVLPELLYRWPTPDRWKWLTFLLVLLPLSMLIAFGLTSTVIEALFGDQAETYRFSPFALVGVALLFPPIALEAMQRMELVNTGAAPRKVALFAGGAGAAACMVSALLLQDFFVGAGLATISIVAVAAAIALAMVAPHPAARRQ